MTHGVPTSGVIGNELAGSAGMTETLCIAWKQWWTWRDGVSAKKSLHAIQILIALFSPPAFSLSNPGSPLRYLLSQVVSSCVFMTTLLFKSHTTSHVLTNFHIYSFFVHAGETRVCSKAMS